MYTSIYPGQPWLDTEGKRIQAHGGSVLYWEGSYYWYGENKEKTTGENKIWHWGGHKRLCRSGTDRRWGWGTGIARYEWRQLFNCQYKGYGLEHAN